MQVSPIHDIALHNGNSPSQFLMMEEVAGPSQVVAAVVFALELRPGTGTGRSLLRRMLAALPEPAVVAAAVAGAAGTPAVDIGIGSRRPAAAGLLRACSAMLAVQPAAVAVACVAGAVAGSVRCSAERLLLPCWQPMEEAAAEGKTCRQTAKARPVSGPAAAVVAAEEESRG